MMWDSGRAPTTVIEHGMPDPGPRYTGELPRAAAVINEPVRRARIVGTPDLAAELGKQSREAALARYGLELFLRDWDWLLTETVASGR